MVAPCIDGLDALARFKQTPENYDLVITDQTMPGLTGINLAARLLAVKQDLLIILCTGFSRIVDRDKAKESGNQEFPEQTYRPATFRKHRPEAAGT